MIDRRNFLIGGSALIGFPFIEPWALAQEKAAAWHREGLSRMKKEGRCGVVIPVPADAAAREKLAGALKAMIEKGGFEARAVLMGPVVICLPGAGTRLQLLDPDGKQMATGRMTVSTLEASLTGLVVGKEGAHLTAQIDALDPDRRGDVERLIARLGAYDYAERQAAMKALVIEIPFGIPLMHRAHRRTRDPEIRVRLQKVVEDFYTATRPLPYGARWEKREVVVGGGCGGSIEREDGTVAHFACGMAVIRKESRKFLTFLTRK